MMHSESAIRVSGLSISARYSLNVSYDIAQCQQKSVDMLSVNKNIQRHLDLRFDPTCLSASKWAKLRRNTSNLPLTEHKDVLSTKVGI